MKLSLSSSIRPLVFACVTVAVAACASTEEAPTPVQASPGIVERSARDGTRVLVERDASGRATSELALYVDTDSTLAKLTLHGETGDLVLRTRAGKGRQYMRIVAPGVDRSWEGAEDEARPADLTSLYEAHFAGVLDRWTRVHLADPRFASYYNGPSSTEAAAGSIAPQDFGEVACHFAVTVVCGWVTKKLVPTFVCGEVTSKLCDAPPPPTPCGSGKCDGSKSCTSCERDCGFCGGGGSGDCSGRHHIPEYC